MAIGGGISDLTRYLGRPYQCGFIIMINTAK